MTIFETVSVNNGTPITSAQTLFGDEPTTTYDSLYVPSLYVNGTVTGNGVELIYPTVYVGIQDFQAVTDCSIPGCTALEDCNPQAVEDYESKTGFPFAGITTTGYYYINAGVDFGESFDQDEVQPFLSLLGLQSDCPVVLQGPPYTLMPVAQLTETYTITSSYQGQTPSPVASPWVVTPSTIFAPSAPYYLTTATQKTNTVVQPLIPSSTPTLGGVTMPTASVYLNSVPSLTPSPVSLGPSVGLIASTSPPPSPPTTAAVFPVIDLGASSITMNSVSQYTVGSQTLVPGGPAITISGTTISLATSASAIIVNGITQNLPQVVSLQPSGLPPRPYITIGSSIITANTAGLYLVGTQALVAGGPAITVSGTTISLAPSASALIVNGITQTIPTTPISLPTNQPSTEPPLIWGSITLIANSAGTYILGLQTLTPGGPGITISGTTISLASSDVAVIVNGHTYPAETVYSTPTLYPAIATVDGEIISLNSALAYKIGSQTLTPGGPAITIDGTLVSLETVGTGVELVVAGSIEVLTFPTLAGGPAVSSTEGLGGIIYSGFVGSTMPSATSSIVVDTSGAKARWEMHWWSYVLLGTLIVLGRFSQ
ncbi:hypothetical protein MMC17_003473 [Xylographa soralifera]|nr:hypothetical protein [Xylographa soralifera]